MRIILDEERFSKLMVERILEYNIYDGNADHNPYAKKLNTSMEALENLISREGYQMVNIENGKNYLVYEIVSMANIIGVRYCLSRLIKNGEPYGSIYVKPLSLYRPIQ
jgi:hypothetical protein